jgi:hypothetical protein
MQSTRLRPLAGCAISAQEIQTKISQDLKWRTEKYCRWLDRAATLFNLLHRNIGDLVMPGDTGVAVAARKRPAALTLDEQLLLPIVVAGWDVDDVTVFEELAGEQATRIGRPPNGRASSALASPETATRTSSLKRSSPTWRMACRNIGVAPKNASQPGQIASRSRSSATSTVI